MTRSNYARPSEDDVKPAERLNGDNASSIAIIILQLPMPDIIYSTSRMHAWCQRSPEEIVRNKTDCLICESKKIRLKCTKVEPKDTVF